MFVSFAPLCCGRNIVLLRPYQLLQRLKYKDSNNGGSTSKEPTTEISSHTRGEQAFKEIFYHIVFTVRKIPYIQTMRVRKTCAKSGPPNSQIALAQRSKMSFAHALQAIQPRLSAEITRTRSLVQPQPALFSANVVTITKS